MQNENTPPAASANKIGAILAEFELFKENYACDDLVLAMVEQLQRVQNAAQLDTPAVIALANTAGMTWIPKTGPNDDYLGADEIFPDVTVTQLQRLLLLAGAAPAQAVDELDETAFIALCELAGLTWVPKPSEDDLFQEGGEEFVNVTIPGLRILLALTGCASRKLVSDALDTAAPAPSAPVLKGLQLAWAKFEGGKKLSPEDAFLFGAGYLAGYRPQAENTVIVGTEREKLLYVARVLRAIGDLSRTEPLGALWSEAIVSVSTLKRVLDIADEDCEELGLTPKSMTITSPDGAIPESMLLNGWKEAAIAWEVCASIHRQYAKGKDALFTTRQGDFVRGAETARTKFKTILG